jgi:hypothetical protein
VEPSDGLWQFAAVEFQNWSETGKLKKAEGVGGRVSDVTWAVFIQGRRGNISISCWPNYLQSGKEYYVS